VETPKSKNLEAHRPSLALYQKISTVEPGVLIFLLSSQPKNPV